jgi:hypothetical protein
MSAANIDVNELIGVLNAQIAGQNLELHVAKLQIAGLQKEIETLSKRLEKDLGEPASRSKTRS